MENQNYILDAVKNLNERLVAIEEKVEDEKLMDLKNIVERQTMIDRLIVKNCDDIAIIKRVKEENEESIKCLESRIDKLNKEIEDSIDESKFINESNHDDQNKNIEIRCKHYNRGFCKHKSLCRYVHPRTVCEAYLKDGKCSLKTCSSRHPKKCKYQNQGCFRGHIYIISLIRKIPIWKMRKNNLIML